MGNQKQKWKAEEEEALLAGVAKHGPGKWKNILKDPEFAPFLTHRSNIDLKDKWRNLSVNPGGSGAKDKSRTPKLKAVAAAAAAAAASTPNAPNSTPSGLVNHNASADIALDDPSNSPADGNNAPRYNSIIFEALSTIKDPNGCDISAIVNYIEQRQEVPQNFRRSLSSRLRRLVAQGKLEKVQNCYKIREDTSLENRTAILRQKDVRLRPPQNSPLATCGRAMEEASVTAAYRLAEAENKSYLAAEAVKEAERISKMAEDTDSMLQIVQEIYDQCARGEIVPLV
ncbi:telomere repeat-binding factor 4-like [Carica papaya]|uniref:telomere repeat-binding factor 4-like n=1 Tax=Carica papaya TaxID=3649 RepID=UPI000B8C78A6|nr:telomere repeat-binding factor 4-like [Carica papaya]